jgi:nucleoside 2-deoxyribosyltransferase
MGYRVYYSNDDNPYEYRDDIGYQICEENTRAISESDEVHIFWDETSSGSLFDLGTAFGLHKPLKIVNLDSVQSTPTKSFSNMILEWSKKTS